MRRNTKIDELLEKLVALHLTMGLQPSEVADAAFERHYKRIDISRTNAAVCMVIVFDDYDGTTTKQHTVRYAYNIERRLQSIEQKIGNGPFKMQWDRNELSRRLVDEIVGVLAEINSAEEVERFLSTVPDEVRGRIASSLQQVA